MTPLVACPGGRTAERLVTEGSIEALRSGGCGVGTRSHRRRRPAPETSARRRPGRPARCRRRRGPPVPRRGADRRLPRRRPLLRPVGIPDHVAPAHGVTGERSHPVGRILGSPGPAPAPGARPAARRRGGLLPRPRRAAGAGPDPGRRVRDDRLRRQLAVDRLRERLLRTVPAAVAARAHLEPRDRGAVLSRVAARVRGAARLASGAHPACRARHLAGARSRLERIDGRALRPG